jgi:hypothetical protein
VAPVWAAARGFEFREDRSQRGPAGMRMQARHTLCRKCSGFGARYGASPWAIATPASAITATHAASEPLRETTLCWPAARSFGNPTWPELGIAGEVVSAQRFPADLPAASPDGTSKTLAFQFRGGHDARSWKGLKSYFNELLGHRQAASLLFPTSSTSL